jgi:DNA-binding NtrC family response regulator
MINVLVVDDEEPFRRLLKKELTRKGYAVEVAPDGSEALRLLRDRSFDVILLDVVMPGVDGISLMKKLKEDSGSPSIIVLTGKATVETAVEAMKNGAFDYLTKPYKLDELVIVVNRAYEFSRLSVTSRNWSDRKPPLNSSAKAGRSRRFSRSSRRWGPRTRRSSSRARAGPARSSSRTRSGATANGRTRPSSP